jgi:hypothetical protein
MVLIYRLTPSPFVQTNYFNSETILTGGTELVYTKNLTALPLNEFSNKIKEVITDFQKKPERLFGSSEFWKNSSQFPFYYRPDKKIRETLSNFLDSFNVNSLENMVNLTNKVKLSTTSINQGFDLVSNDENLPREPFKVINEIYVPSETKKINNTCTLVGSDTIFLLSHLSTPSNDLKNKVDLSNSIYGVSANTVYDQIRPNTSSMVRGEELLELLNLIVNFLVTHDHPYPMLPPSPISRASGVTSADLLTKIQEAYQKVLNSNIRIN